MEPGNLMRRPLQAARVEQAGGSRHGEAWIDGHV